MGCATVTSGGGGGTKALVLGLQPLRAHPDADTSSSVSTRRRRRGSFLCGRALRRSFRIVMLRLLLLGRCWQRRCFSKRCYLGGSAAFGAIEEEKVLSALVTRRKDVAPIRAYPHLIEGLLRHELGAAAAHLPAATERAIGG